MAKRWQTISPEDGDALIQCGVPVYYRYKLGRGHAWMLAMYPVLKQRSSMVDSWKERDVGKYIYKGKLLHQELQVRVEIDA